MSKIPHDPERVVGRWVFGMNQRLFRVTSVSRDRGTPLYHGETLTGDPAASHVVTVLDQRDQEALAST